MYRKKQQSELTVITWVHELCSCIITVVMQKDCAVRTSIFSSLREIAESLQSRRNLFRLAFLAIIFSNSSPLSNYHSGHSEIIFSYSRIILGSGFRQNAFAVRLIRCFQERGSIGIGPSAVMGQVFSGSMHVRNQNQSLLPG